MEDFRRHTDALASLETFDPSVFVGDDEAPQEVCSLILSLALIWNDCRDVSYARSLLSASRPPSEPGPTREWGDYGGIDLHLFRYQVGLLHELMALVCREQFVARGYYLERLAIRLPSEVRDAWYSLVQVAAGTAPTDPLGQRLLTIRDRVHNNYDPRRLLTGYRNHFLGEHREDDRAFISRGGDTGSTRFYFADAAAMGYLEEVPGGDDWDQLREDVQDVMRYVGDALMGIVDGFINRRTGAAVAVAASDEGHEGHVGP